MKHISSQIVFSESGRDNCSLEESALRFPRRFSLWNFTIRWFSYFKLKFRIIFTSSCRQIGIPRGGEFFLSDCRQRCRRKTSILLSCVHPLMVVSISISNLHSPHCKLSSDECVQVGRMDCFPAYGGNGKSRNVSCSKPSLNWRKRSWEGALNKWLTMYYIVYIVFDAIHKALYKWFYFNFCIYLLIIMDK